MTPLAYYLSKARLHKDILSVAEEKQFVHVLQSTPTT
jgi:hypothetical protein